LGLKEKLVDKEAVGNLKYSAKAIAYQREQVLMKNFVISLGSLEKSPWRKENAFQFWKERLHESGGSKINPSLFIIA